MKKNRLLGIILITIIAIALFSACSKTEEIRPTPTITITETNLNNPSNAILDSGATFTFTLFTTASNIKTIAIERVVSGIATPLDTSYPAKSGFTASTQDTRTINLKVLYPVGIQLSIKCTVTDVNGLVASTNYLIKVSKTKIIPVTVLYAQGATIADLAPGSVSLSIPSFYNPETNLPTTLNNYAPGDDISFGVDSLDSTKLYLVSADKRATVLHSANQTPATATSIALQATTLTVDNFASITGNQLSNLPIASGSSALVQKDKVYSFKTNKGTIGLVLITSIDNSQSNPNNTFRSHINFSTKTLRTGQ